MQRIFNNIGTFSSTSVQLPVIITDNFLALNVMRRGAKKNSFEHAKKFEQLNVMID